MVRPIGAPVASRRRRVRDVSAVDELEADGLARGLSLPSTSASPATTRDDVVQARDMTLMSTLIGICKAYILALS